MRYCDKLIKLGELINRVGLKDKIMREFVCSYLWEIIIEIETIDE